MDSSFRRKKQDRGMSNVNCTYFPLSTLVKEVKELSSLYISRKVIYDRREFLQDV